jgi:uncharacterized protein HemX
MKKQKYIYNMKARIPKKENGSSRSRTSAKVTVLKGSSQAFIVAIFLTLFLTSGMYLFSVNRNAVQGYHLRALEKEITRLSAQNAELQIAEADMRSFYRINEVKDDLQMEKAPQLKYLEPKKDTVALR